MADCTFIDVTCHAKNLVSDGMSAVARDTFERMCHAFADAGGAVLNAVAGNFLAGSSIDLRHSGINRVFTVSTEIGGVLALVLLVGQVIRTAFTMRGEHLATGVVGVFKAGLATTSVLAVAALLLTVSDELSQTIMDQTSGGAQAFTNRFAEVGNSSAVGNPAEPVALLLVYGVVAILVGLILFGEMLFRHALVVVMVALSPIAAAGMVAGTGTDWWRRHVAAGLRLIFLKPLIVLIFGISFGVAGSSDGIINVLAGLMTLVVAAMAWPLLAKACTVSAGHVGAAGGPGAFVGGLFGAGASAALTGRVMSRQANGSMFDSDRATITRNVAAMDAGPSRGTGGAGGGLALVGGGAYAALRVAAHAKEHLKGGFDQMSGHAGLGGELHAPQSLRYDLGPQYPVATQPPPAERPRSTPPPGHPPTDSGA